MELLQELKKENDNSFRRAENNLKKLLSEINNITEDLPTEMYLRKDILSSRLRMFVKRLDELSYEVERLSAHSTALEAIKNQL